MSKYDLSLQDKFTIESCHAAIRTAALVENEKTSDIANEKSLEIQREKISQNNMIYSQTTGYLSSRAKTMSARKLLKTTFIVLDTQMHVKQWNIEIEIRHKICQQKYFITKLDYVNILHIICVIQKTL